MLGGAESAMQGDAESTGAGIGSDARTPDTTPMIGEAEAESGGGSAMSGGAMMIGGGAMPSAASPSVGGCGGQMMPGMPAAPGVILWWLAPGVTMWYGRRKSKRGVS